MLELWYQNLEDNYRVVNFIEDVKEWEQEGFLDHKIWAQLAQKIDQGVLPRSPTKFKEEPSKISTKEGNLIKKRSIQNNWILIVK